MHNRLTNLICLGKLVEMLRMHIDNLENSEQGDHELPGGQDRRGEGEEGEEVPGGEYGGYYADGGDYSANGNGQEEYM